MNTDERMWNAISHITLLIGRPYDKSSEDKVWWETGGFVEDVIIAKEAGKVRIFVLDVRYVKIIAWAINNRYET